MDFVMLDAALGGVALDVIGMHVAAARDPGAVPGMARDDYAVAGPAEAGVSPAPGGERRANGDAAAEADGATDEEAGAWGREDHKRVINRNVIKSRIHGSDGDVGSGRDEDLWAGSEIAVVISVVAL